MAVVEETRKFVPDPKTAGYGHARSPPKKSVPGIKPKQ